jgi:predicted nuclease of predicted toxin-antitoxin system
MKWLLDEMLPAGACKHLAKRGQDALSVHDVGLSGAEDARVFDYAVREARVIATENFADYAILLEQRMGRGERCVPVVFVRKADLPQRGALAVHLAVRLEAWARKHPEPYLGAHWA